MQSKAFIDLSKLAQDREVKLSPDHLRRVLKKRESFGRENRKKWNRLQEEERRLSILGIWQPGFQFVYGLAIGSFNSQSYIKMMDEQAMTGSRRV